MKRFASLGLAVLATSLCGCQDNDSSLFIRGVLAVERTDCTARPEAGATLRIGGTLDVLLRPTRDYTASFLVGSQLSTQGDRNRARTETARLVITGAEVRIHDIQDNLLDEYTVRASGFIDPAPSADSPGFGAVTATIVQAGSNIGVGDYIVKVRVFGETLGHQEIESSELQYPLTICEGCLISYPPDAFDTANLTDECTADQNDQIPRGFCSMGQDAAVDCRLCAEEIPECRTP